MTPRHQGPQHRPDVVSTPGPATTGAAHRSSRGRAWWLLAHHAVITTGLVTVGLGALLYGLGGAGLAQVDPSELGHGTTYANHEDQDWMLAAIAMVAAGTVLCAGLPRRGRAPEHIGAAGQVMCAMTMTGAAAAGTGFITAFYFAGPTTMGGPSDDCYHQGCWPLLPQLLGQSVPVLLAAAALVVAALVSRRSSWWTRALGPAAVWVMGVLLTHALWDPWFLPVLQGPPR